MTTKNSNHKLECLSNGEKLIGSNPSSNYKNNEEILKEVENLHYNYKESIKLAISLTQEEARKETDEKVNKLYAYCLNFLMVDIIDGINEVFGKEKKE